MSHTQLTEYERYQIYTLLKEGFNQNKVAQSLGRHPSTISRELARNRGGKGYRPAQAQRKSELRRRSAAKSVKLTAEVIGWVKELVRQDLSPQQVSLYLHEFKDIQLHHETIYQLIYADKEEGGDLYKHLRVASKNHRKRYGIYDRRGRIQNRVGIEERPIEVDLQTRIGDWEGDTIIGKGRKSALFTLVERKTLYTIIIKLNGKNAEELADKVTSELKELSHRIKTITLDNGLEFAEHERIASELKAKIYFANPYASWERGINENTNGLIRQYFPKGSDFSEVGEEEIQFAMERLNNRPRATRGGKTPNELFLGQRVDLLAA